MGWRWHDWGISVSQRKYTLDLLMETWLDADLSIPLWNSMQNWEIFYVVSTVCQFMQAPMKNTQKLWITFWDTWKLLQVKIWCFEKLTENVLRFISTLIVQDQLLTESPLQVTVALCGVILLLGWVRSRVLSLGVVLKSNTGLWVWKFVKRSRCKVFCLILSWTELSMKLFCDNKAAIIIANNSVLHDRNM